MDMLCPFWKDQCKKNECVAWKDDACLIILCMKHFSSSRGNSARSNDSEKEPEAVKKVCHRLLARKQRLDAENEKVIDEIADTQKKLLEYAREPQCDTCKESILKELGSLLGELKLIAQESQEIEASLAELKTRENA